MAGRTEGLFDVVIQLLEGRGLKRIATRRQAVVAQGNLLNHLQESPPAAWGRGKRASDPIWGDDAVLRWQVDSATLHRLTSRSPFVRLNLYARSPHGTSYGADTSLGQVVVDLRRAATTLSGASDAAEPQWYPLANDAPGEVLLSSRVVAMRSAGGPEAPLAASASRGPAAVHAPPDARRSLERGPTVMVPADADCITIGAGGPESSVFTLAISIFSLPNLLPFLGDQPGPFWLSYKLFGVLVQTEQFQQPLAPSFPSIRDAFRVRSTPAELARFLRELPPLQVFLCGPSVFLGICPIPFEGLADAMASHDGRKVGSLDTAVRVAGGFPLRRMQSVKSKAQDGSVRLSLELAASGAAPEVLLAAELELDIDAGGDAAVPAASSGQGAPVASQPRGGVAPPAPAPAVPAEPAVRASGNPLAFSAPAGPHDPMRRSGASRGAAAEPAADAPVVRRSASGAGAGAGAGGGASRAGGPAGREEKKEAPAATLDWEDPQPRHYRFSVELRAVKQVYQPSDVYAKYRYPSFGRNTAVRTRPPVRVGRHAERLLPNSFCFYEFAMSRVDLRTTLERAPLQIELWHHDRVTKDSRLGVATVKLHKMIKKPVFFRCGDGKMLTDYTAAIAHQRSLPDTLPKGPGHAAHRIEGVRIANMPVVALQAYDVWVPVKDFADGDAAGGRYMKTAALHAVVFIEDLGPLTLSPSQPQLLYPPPRDESSLNLGLDAEPTGGVDEDAETQGGDTTEELVGRLDQHRLAAQTTPEARHEPGPKAEAEHKAEHKGSGVADTADEDGAGAGIDGTPSSEPSRGAFESKEQPASQPAPAAAPAPAPAPSPPPRPRAILPPSAPAPSTTPAVGGVDPNEAVQLLLQRQQAELQAWKEEQMREFVRALQQKEAQHMAAFEKAWADREKEREAQLLEAQTELERLEARLRKKLVEVENRERAVKTAEEKAATKVAHQMNDVRVLQRRLREEAEHQIGMERMKLEAIERSRATTERELAKTRARARELEEEFDAYRRHQRNSPESKLRDEIRQLELQNADLMRQVEAAKGKTALEQREREKLKMQLFRCAREVQRHKKYITHLQQQESQRLRMAYLAQEERFVLDDDRQTLRQISSDLETLRRTAATGLGAQDLRPASDGDGDGEARAGSAHTSPEAAAADAAPAVAAAASTHVSAGASGGQPAYTVQYVRTSAEDLRALLAREALVSGGGGAYPATGGHGVGYQPTALPQASTDGAGAGAGAGGGGSPEGSPAEPSKLGDAAAGFKSRELDRLRQERWDLLATGSYTVGDPIVKALDQRMHDLTTGATSAGPSTSARHVGTRPQ